MASVHSEKKIGMAMATAKQIDPLKPRPGDAAMLEKIATDRVAVENLLIMLDCLSFQDNAKQLQVIASEAAAAIRVLRNAYCDF